MTPKSIFSQVLRRSFSDVCSEYGSRRTTTPTVPAGGGAAGGVAVAPGTGACPGGSGWICRAPRIFSARRASPASGVPG